MTRHQNRRQPCSKTEPVDEIVEIPIEEVKNEPEVELYHEETPVKLESDPAEHTDLTRPYHEVTGSYKNFQEAKYAATKAKFAATPELRAKVAADWKHKTIKVKSLVDEFVEDFMSDFDERFISSLLDDLVAQSLNDAYADYMLYLVKSEEMLKPITFQGDFVPDLQFECENDHF